MKLRNKKTGEIIGSLGSFIIQNPNHINCEAITKYDSLAELNAEWEDVPEPKEYWFIDAFGNIIQNRITKRKGDAYTDMSSDYEMQKSIGNYFETKEEAEKAVKKFKAFKRLKDKGFEFEGYDDGYKHDFNSGHIEFYVENDVDVLKDLDLLFGGEE